MTKIALIHAVLPAMAPVEDAFKKLWPETRRTNLLDDSLSADREAAGSLTPEISARMMALAAYAAGTGADAVLFTCSAFGDAIDAAARALPIPVLKPNEAMFELALEAGVSIVSTPVLGRATTWSLRPSCHHNHRTGFALCPDKEPAGLPHAIIALVSSTRQMLALPTCMVLVPSTYSIPAYQTSPTLAQPTSLCLALVVLPVRSTLYNHDKVLEYARDRPGLCFLSLSLWWVSSRVKSPLTKYRMH